MEEKKEILEIISEDLEKEISRYEEEKKQSEKYVTLINIDPVAYNRAWFNYGSVSVALHHFYTLKRLIEGRDVKKVLNFLIFTLHQIETATDFSTFDKRESDDFVHDAQYKVADRFHFYSCGIQVHTTGRPMQDFQSYDFLYSQKSHQ